MLTVSARRALHRPVVRRITVAFVALATALAVGLLVRSGTEARHHWGTARPVVVAQRDLTPGEVVDASAVELRQLPVAVIGDAALATEPIGSVVRYPIIAGEPLVRDRLAPQGVSGVAALVPDGDRAVSVPTGLLGTPPLHAGDRVDLLVVVASTGDIYGQSADSAQDLASGEPAFPLVSAAPVVDVNEQAVTVAVPSADAPRVAYAIANGVVVLALTGR